MVVWGQILKILYLQYFNGLSLYERMRCIPALFISLYAVSITQFEQTSLINKV